MAKQTRSFKYARRSEADVKARANQSTGNFASFIKSQYKKYKMRDGKNIIRVLPPTWEKPDHYGYDIWLNYGVGADNESYLSLSKMNNEKDPLAEARIVANREGDEELAKQLQPRKRVIMWVIDRQAEEEGPQVFDAPVTVDKAMANISLDEDTKEVIFIDDPEEGCDFRFYKEGQGLKTDYDASRMKLMKPGPLSQDEEQQNEWLEFVKENQLPDVLNFYDYEHISAVFDGKGPSKSDDEDKKPVRTRAKAVEPEDEDSPPARRGGVARLTQKEAEAETEDDEDVPPAKNGRARARAEPEDDEEDAGVKRTLSIGERLKQRRQAATVEDEED